MVIHVPHASTVMPEGHRAQFGISDEALETEIHQSADLHTDLLARQAWPQAEIVEARVSRVLLDVERYADDALEQMARVGRGVIYTHDCSGGSLQRTVSSKDRGQLLDTFYHPHWKKLRADASDAVLIDLHTYPEKAWPIEPRIDAARPEIDLGTSAGITPIEWTAGLWAHFERHGFTVEENTPYSGVIDAGAKHAVMIEIRRDVLGSGPGSPEWHRLVSALATLPLPG
ncbi:MAG: N-formylglutamate amidohydrolase [Pararhodobacter sp.]|nr:N-formylglutamate amidohydrolase [Pararhodobacter sp.]